MTNDLPPVANVPDDPNVEKWVTNVTEGVWSDRAIRTYTSLYPDLVFSTGEPNDTFAFDTAALKAKGLVGIYARKKKHG